MYIKFLKLKNFRNYKEIFLEFTSGINFFIGNNGEGKTNLIEALNYFNTGRSFRSNKDSSVIKFNCSECSVSGVFLKNNIKLKIKVEIFGDRKKRIIVNNKKLPRLCELFNKVQMVIFTEGDINIIKGNPEARRGFIDEAISKLDSEYLELSREYKNLLAQRNALIKSEKKDFYVLDYLNKKLSTCGSKIIVKRYNFIENLKELLNKLEKRTGFLYEFNLKYITCVKNPEKPDKELYGLLKSSLETDIRKGYTCIGPHRDNINFFLGKRNVKEFASAGEIKTFAVMLKLSLFEFIKEKLNTVPVILLDDFFSELDSKNIYAILNSVEKQAQIIATSVDFFNLMFPAKVFRISGGEIVAQN